MMRSVLALLWALLFCCVTHLQAESPPEPAHDLVKDVVYNELQERRSVSLWQYRVEKTVVNQTLVQQQVETRSGPVFRVLARQGRPLDEAGRKKETDRLNSLLRSPGDQARMKQDYEAEEQRVQRLIGAMPDAFLYTYDGMAEGNAKLSFRPNPAYNPQTYEARVFHALAGEVWIQPQQKRLVKIDGHIDSQIDFGWGILGRIEKGGTFQIGREAVAPNRWKTNMLNVHVSGHIVFFKTIGKDQREVRSAYQPVPQDCSVADAVKILDASLTP
jgi:hypothetical protein